MEFKKCARCGSFFTSANSVCCNCEIKDRADINKAHNYIVENSDIISVEDLSLGTGISIANLNRFIGDNNIPDLNSKL